MNYSDWLKDVCWLGRGGRAENAGDVTQKVGEKQSMGRKAGLHLHVRKVMGSRAEKGFPVWKWGNSRAKLQIASTVLRVLLLCHRGHWGPASMLQRKIGSKRKSQQVQQDLIRSKSTKWGQDWKNSALWSFAIQNRWKFYIQRPQKYSSFGVLTQVEWMLN